MEDPVATLLLDVLSDEEVTPSMRMAYTKELRDHINALQAQIKIMRVENDELRAYNKSLMEMLHKATLPPLRTIIKKPLGGQDE